MQLPVRLGLDLLLKCIEKQQEQRAWSMWLMKYQHMDKQSFVPFSKFYSATIQPQQVSHRPAEAILSDVAEIRKQFSERG